MPHTNRTAKGVFGGLLGLVGLSAVAGLLVTATVTPAIAVTGAAATQAMDMFEGIPSYLEVNAPMERSIMYASDGDQQVEIAQFYDQNRVPLTFDQLGTNIVDAILSSEDKTFFDHSGINLGATIKAVYDNLRQTSSRGASTITQQFVKNVQVQECEQTVDTNADDYLQQLQDCADDAITATGMEGVQRKLQEMRYALQLEKEYSKNDILLGYLNIANFGGKTYGIEAAANTYFGTSTKDLTIAQAATLAGMVQNPNTYRIDKKEGSTSRAGEPANGEFDEWAITKERRDYVLNMMRQNGKITQEQYREAVAEPITPNIQTPPTGCVEAGENSYYCQMVKTIIENDPALGKDLLRRGGLKIYTSLDLRLQRAANETMQAHAPAAVDGMGFGAAGVSLETSTGRVLALTQNTKFTERGDRGAGYTSLVFGADRTSGSASGGFEVGSTYKIFTLIDWMEKGHSVNQILNGRDRTFTEWTCNGAKRSNSTHIGNYDDDRGRVSTVQRFTELSLNSGYLAMATQLDVCEINAVADRMGVTYGTGEKVTSQSALYDVLGSKNISPLSMASAYAAVANNGVRCTPRAIDKIVAQDGTELPLPEATCTEVIAPNVAATAAYTLERVMQNGTGRPARPGGGVPVFGKTGTHQGHQTMMIESSTEVTTSVWVGNYDGGTTRLRNQWHDGLRLSELRYRLAADMQRAANDLYGGEDFPNPDRNLLRTVYTNLPEVIGMTAENATTLLEDAGFNVRVGDPVDSDLPVGQIAAQDPGPGRVPTGTTVTISPSNGQGATVPGVEGMPPAAAIARLQAAGFTNVTIGECTQEPTAPMGGEATGTSPGEGTPVSKNAQIRVDFRALMCR